jgi:hypothetical protein
MTTAALGRTSRIVRLHLANPRTTIVLPALIVGAIFLMTLAIWTLISANLDPSEAAEASEGTQYSGASSWIFVYMLIVAVQAMNLTFPLALGYGSTRRDFYLGSALTFVLLSAGWAVGLTILSGLETLTGGWGVGLHMFTAIYFGGGEMELWQRLVVFFCVMLFFFFTGAAFGAVYVRWKATGLIVAFIALGALLVGAIALFTYTRSWDVVGAFFAQAQVLGTALWLLVPTAIGGVIGYLVLRHATPRS